MSTAPSKYSHHEAWHDAAASHGEMERRDRHVVDLLRRLFRGFEGAFRLRLWNGAVLTLGTAAEGVGEPPFTLVFRDPAVVGTMLGGRDPLRIAEAYFQGGIDVEGDFFAAVKLKDYLHSLCLSSRDRWFALLTILRLQLRRAMAPITHRRHTLLRHSGVKEHSRHENKDAVRFHYDVSNDFYALWLDEAMVYSCAYFEHPWNSLEQAQAAKLDHICRKLLLNRGDRLLDIGCGWGALVIHAAQYYGVQAHGITLSEQQLELARKRIAEAGLEGQVTVELRDYRDLEGDAVYDKVASVGMFEHVGLKNLPTYFQNVYRLLKPEGLFLNHGVTHDVEGWSKTVSTEFINRYVFPDGQLDTISNIQRRMEQECFEIIDVEALRSHYALTLRHWVARLEEQEKRALQYVSDAAYRVWRLYMAGCALDFEAGTTGVYQVLSCKRGGNSAQLPLTRRHLYTDQKH